MGHILLMFCILVGGRPGGQPLRPVRGGAGPARWRLPHQRPALLRVAGGQRGQGEHLQCITSRLQYSTSHLQYSTSHLQYSTSHLQYITSHLQYITSLCICTIACRWRILMWRLKLQTASLSKVVQHAAYGWLIITLYQQKWDIFYSFFEW